MIEKMDRRFNKHIGRFQFGVHIMVHPEGGECGRRVVIHPSFVMDLKRKSPVDPVFLAEKERIDRELEAAWDEYEAGWETGDDQHYYDLPSTPVLEADPELERLLAEEEEIESNLRQAQDDDFADREWRRRMGW